eukprot:525837-Pyramimonas_sp.AAC.1
MESGRGFHDAVHHVLARARAQDTGVVSAYMEQLRGKDCNAIERGHPMNANVSRRETAPSHKSSLTEVGAI